MGMLLFHQPSYLCIRFVRGNDEFDVIFLQGCKDAINDLAGYLYPSLCVLPGCQSFTLFSMFFCEVNVLLSRCISVLEGDLFMWQNSPIEDYDGLYLIVFEHGKIAEKNIQMLSSRCILKYLKSSRITRPVDPRQPINRSLLPSKSRKMPFRKSLLKQTKQQLNTHLLYIIYMDNAEKINQLIVEHLQIMGYEKTVAVLTTEMKHDQRWRILVAFQQCRREDFFLLFEPFLKTGKASRKKKVERDILEFQLHTYFLAHALKQNDKSLKMQHQVSEERKAFEHFISIRGKQFTSYPQLLPFYSLAYIQHPNNHDPFSTLFSKNWDKELRDKLQHFISQDKPSNLQKLVEKRSTNEVQIPQAIINLSKTQQDNLTMNLNQWFNIIKQLSKDAETLLLTLQNHNILFSNELKRIEERVNSYAWFYNQKFLEALNLNIQLLGKGVELEAHGEPEIPFVGLSVEKVKRTIEGSKMEDKRALLKGIQSRIRHLSISPKAKRQFVILLQKYDLLHLRDEKFRLGSRLLQKQLRADCLKVLLGISRDYHGVKYLSECAKLLRLLIVISRKSDKQQKIRVIQIFERLAAQPSLHQMFIREGIIDLLLKLLTEMSEIQDSVMSILFQLSEKKIGKDCLEKADAISLYMKLTDRPQEVQSKILIYANIWMLIDRPSLRKRAHQLGLLQASKRCIMQAENPRDVIQSIHILRRMLGHEEQQDRRLNQSQYIDGLLEDQGQDQPDLQQGHSLTWFIPLPQQQQIQRTSTQLVLKQEIDQLMHRYQAASQEGDVGGRGSQSILKHVDESWGEKKGFFENEMKEKKRGIKEPKEVPEAVIEAKEMVKVQYDRELKKQYSSSPYNNPHQSPQPPTKSNKKRRNRLQQLNEQLQRSQCLT